MKSLTGPAGPADESGFTLVELLLAIAVIAVITVPLGDVVVGYLRNTDATSARLLTSLDVQITSGYWARDVAGLGHRNTDDELQPSMTVPAMAPDPNCTVTGTLATLTSDDYPVTDPPSSTDPPVVSTVTYSVAFDGESKQCELHRVSSASPTDNKVLAHHLDPLTPPTVKCSTPCTTAPTVNETATLTLTLTDPGSPGGTYQVPLVGQRRGSS